MRVDEKFAPQCKRCKSKRCPESFPGKSRPIRGEPDGKPGRPFEMGGLDENDPKSMAKWMKRMGQDGEDVGDVDQMMDEAMQEEASAQSGQETEE